MPETTPSPPSEVSLFRQAALEHRHIQLEGDLSLRPPRYLGLYLVGLVLACGLSIATFLFVPITIHYTDPDIIVSPSRPDGSAVTISSPVADRAWPGGPHSSTLSCNGQMFRLVSPSLAIREPVQGAGPLVAPSARCRLEMTVAYRNLRSIPW
jgi:hypothetical protein